MRSTPCNILCRGHEFGYEVLNHYTQTKSVVINMEDGLVGMYAQ